jgi:hypothetical protein
MIRERRTEPEKGDASVSSRSHLLQYPSAESRGGERYTPVQGEDKGLRI